MSALGFGAMRLPTLGKESDVDEPAAVKMLRNAVDHGVNYIDTAYVYHGGNGEAVVGKALANGYRERVHVATKLPIWNVTQRADCDRLFESSFAASSRTHRLLPPPLSAEEVLAPDAGVGRADLGREDAGRRAASAISASRSMIPTTPSSRSSTAMTGPSARSSTTT